MFSKGNWDEKCGYNVARFSEKEMMLFNARQLPDTGSDLYWRIANKKWLPLLFLLSYNANIQLVQKPHA